MGDRAGLFVLQTKATSGSFDDWSESFRMLDDALMDYRKMDLVVIPECFSAYCMPEDADAIGEYSAEIEQALMTRAMMYGTYIVAGSVIARKEDGKIYNTVKVFDRNGFVVGEYDKLHLFDVLDGAGEKSESSFVTPGDHRLVIDADFGKVGVCVCYDIRFPELVRAYAAEGVEYLAVPAAFFSPRGGQWLDLLTAAALQNGMYVAGANLIGNDGRGNDFCGNSAIIDPLGTRLALSPDRPSFAQAFAYKGYALETREKLGIFSGRRPEMY